MKPSFYPFIRWTFSRHQLTINVHSFGHSRSNTDRQRSTCHTGRRLNMKRISSFLFRISPFWQDSDLVLQCPSSSCGILVEPDVKEIVWGAAEAAAGWRIHVVARASMPPQLENNLQISDFSSKSLRRCFVCFVCSTIRPSLSSVYVLASISFEVSNFQIVISLFRRKNSENGCICQTL